MHESVFFSTGSLVSKTIQAIFGSCETAKKKKFFLYIYTSAVSLLLHDSKCHSYALSLVIYKVSMFLKTSYFIALQ